MLNEETIKRALSGIVGKPLWIIRMAVDMPMFHFGQRHPTQTYRGEASEVGDFALHLQCEWYFTKDDSDVLDLHAPYPIVQSLYHEEAGCFTLVFDQGYKLKVIADPDDEDEQWRFFEPTSSKSHLVYQLTTC